MVHSISKFPAESASAKLNALNLAGTDLLDTLLDRAEAGHLSVWDRWCIADSLRPAFDRVVEATRLTSRELPAEVKERVLRHAERFRMLQVDLMAFALSPDAERPFTDRLHLLRDEWLAWLSDLSSSGERVPATPAELLPLAPAF